MFSLISKLIGDSNEKALKKIQPLVNEINNLEDNYLNLSNSDLKNCTTEFKKRLSNGETIESILPEAFAVVRETSKRVLKMRHFDVQIIGGIVLNDGKISEMRTGEGKTLVATLPAYLNALSGNSVHIVTVNDYLAKRDASWMGQIFNFLGLSVGCLQNQASLIFTTNVNDPSSENSSASFAAVAGENLIECNRKEVYTSDIIYGTNNEFGFDYLRDNMSETSEKKVQKGREFAIVDEVDNILIDEARTPLIISGPAKDKGNEYRKFSRLAKTLKENEDFEIEIKRRSIIFTDLGISKIEENLGVQNLYDPDNDVLSHFIENAVRAEYVYEKNRDYVIQEKEILIVDEFTGRLMKGRRFSDGLHQALEAKENLTIQRESITYATITLQNYFRMYEKLSGMTGTASTEAEEFEKIYKLEVVEIPTNKPSQRIDHTDLIFMTETEKWKAIVNKISDVYKIGRPVLVGTTSIDKSELLSSMLKRKGVKHNILNAKQHETDASIIAQAGKPSAVTVATNMAGRGTDIILGGNPETLNLSEEEWTQSNSEVINLGGLFVLGTERHEARRIDNQLRGRCARQGDVGETHFFLSTEDDIVKRFGGDRIKGAMNVMKWDPAIPIENNMITRSVESAQSKVEGQNFEIRKYLVDYDDVVNIQRDVIYRMRDQVLSKSDLRVMISGYLSKELEMISSRNLGVDLEERDVDLIYRELSMVFPDNSDLYDKDQLSEITLEDFDNNINEYINIMFNKREIEFGDEVFIDLQKTILLMSIDQHWVDHLTIMDNMRQGIGLEAAGQRDPLIQYKRMSYQMFNELTERIGSTVARSIFRLAMNSNSTRPHKSNKKSSIPKKTKNQFENENKNEINRKLSRQERRRLERLSKKRK